MALQLMAPLDASSFPGLLGMNSGAGLDANNGANAQDAAFAQANPQHGLTAVLGALGLGPSPLQQAQAQAQVAAAQQAAAAQARAARQQQQGDAAIQAVLANPTPANVAAAVTLNPDKAAALKQAQDARDAETGRLAINEFAAVRNRLATGDVDGAKALLQRHVDAARAAGQDVSADLSMMDSLDKPGGREAALGALGFQLASVIGPERYGQLLTPEEKAADEARQEAALAETVRKDKADENKPIVVPHDSVLVDPRAPAGPASAPAPAAGTTAVAPVPTGGVYDQIGTAAAAAGASSDEQAYLRQLGYVESRGNPNARNGKSTGVFQFHPDTFASAGGGDINSVPDQTRAALNLSRQDKVALQAAGVPPTPANTYIMHQQGAGGGLALLTADPNTNAVAALTPIYRNANTARQAIVNNGGTPNMTAGQFTDMWRAKWAGQKPGQAAPTATDQSASAPQTSGARVLFDNRDQPDPNDPSSQPPDPDTVALQAGIYLGKGTLPPLGVGKYAAAWKTAILQEATRQAKALGLNADDIIAGTVSIKAAGAALQQTEKTLQAVRASEGAVLSNADLALSLAPKGAGTTGVPIFNAWQQHVRDQAFGDPDVSRFNIALKTVADEYARVMSTNTGSGGQTSDSARNEAYGRLATSATPQQLAGNIAVMKQEMANRLNSLQAVHDGLQSSIRGGYGAGGAASPNPNPPPAPVTPAGTVGLGPDGTTPIFTREQALAASKNPSNKGHKFYLQGNSVPQVFH